MPAPHSPCVMVTRAGDAAQRWAQALCEQGIVAQSLPLIEIAPMPDPSAVHSAWQGLTSALAGAAEVAALMFVSAHAVQHFMAQRPATWPLQTLQPALRRAQVQAWGTGPGTQAALQAAHWPQELIRCPQPQAAQFDSEALWARVQADVLGWQGAGKRVLIVRGADAQGHMAGRDWLAQQLQAVGLQVQQCAAYLRRAAPLDPAQQALARQALHSGCWWLFTSSEAAQHLQAQCPDAIGPAARALATHPRIAQRLRTQGWGRVQEVPAAFLAQVASIKLLR